MRAVRASDVRDLRVTATSHAGELCDGCGAGPFTPEPGTGRIPRCHYCAPEIRSSMASLIGRAPTPGPDAVQLVAVVVATGELIGVVMDGRPMTKPETVATCADPFACRSASDGSAIAAGLAHSRGSDVVLCELTYRPERTGARGGRGRARVYQASWCMRPVARAWFGEGDGR